MLILCREKSQAAYRRKVGHVMTHLASVGVDGPALLTKCSTARASVHSFWFQGSTGVGHSNFGSLFFFFIISHKTRLFFPLRSLQHTVLIGKMIALPYQAGACFFFLLIRGLNLIEVDFNHST